VTLQSRVKDLEDWIIAHSKNHAKKEHSHSKLAERVFNLEVFHEPDKPHGNAVWPHEHEEENDS
jgi:hypothetical protein